MCCIGPGSNPGRGFVVGPDVKKWNPRLLKYSPWARLSDGIGRPFTIL